jgi:hypothetical protein
VGTALRNFKKAFDGAEDEWKKIHTLPGPAAADGEETGFVKVHVKERTDRILGATIVASHAGEMINEITLAIVAGIGPAYPCPRHPRLPDPGRSDPESGGRLQPHASDADDPIAAAALAGVVKPGRARSRAVLRRTRHRFSPLPAVP